MLQFNFAARLNVAFAEKTFQKFFPGNICKRDRASRIHFPEPCKTMHRICDVVPRVAKGLRTAQ